MEIYVGADKWRQNADGSWVRWDGSGWRPPDAQHAPPRTPGVVGTNPTEYSDKQGSRWSIDANGQHWRWTGSNWIASDPSPDYAPTPAPAPAPVTPPPPPIPAPAPAPAPPSREPIGGANAPTFTPGMVFGQGQIPGWGGSRDAYQRQWFDVGSGTESLDTQFYNDPNNWQYAWDKVVNQFGGMPGGDFNKFLSGFSGKARNEFQNASNYTNANLNVADFLDQYAPQLKGVYDLLPGQSKGRGGAMPLAGRSNY